jgi:hypothetical protein
MWNNIAENYSNWWNFLKCTGSINGKHIETKCLAQSGSKFVITKSYFQSFCRQLVTSIAD